MNISRLLAATMVAGAGAESEPTEAAAENQSGAANERGAEPGRASATTPRRSLAVVTR
ncbi:MAG TPA: hypothetical protein VHW67_10070 [Solirubrobacteraceae bacterium]|jgi:hypothetical protein|nr:hypothetical protein [Solirubrobacteraceae bacterium]